MDDMTSDLNERLSASCRETLQQLDDIEAKLAGLHAAIERGSGPSRRALASGGCAGRAGRGGKHAARALGPRDVDENLNALAGPRGSVSSFRIRRPAAPPDEPWRPKAARVELAAVANMRRELSVPETWTKI